jgi:hypothetical protein
MLINVVLGLHQGCQIILVLKSSKLPKQRNIPNGSKIHQVDLGKSTKMGSNVSKCSIPRPTKINQNWNFWYDVKHLATLNYIQKVGRWSLLMMHSSIGIDCKLGILNEPEYAGVCSEFESGRATR